MEWIDSFTIFINQIDSVHMKTVIAKFADMASLSMEKIDECRTDLIKGVYDAYVETGDKEDSSETLSRIVYRNCK